MPLIRTEYNPVLLTSSNICDYKGLLREHVAEKLGKKTSDVTTLSAPYEHIGDSVFAAEVVAQIGTHIAKLRYPLDRVDGPRRDAVTGLDVVKNALVVATRELKASNNIEEQIFLTTLPCDWQVDVV